MLHAKTLLQMLQPSFSFRANFSQAGRGQPPAVYSMVALVCAPSPPPLQQQTGDTKKKQTIFSRFFRSICTPLLYSDPKPSKSRLSQTAMVPRVQRQTKKDTHHAGVIYRLPEGVGSCFLRPCCTTPCIQPLLLGQHVTEYHPPITQRTGLCCTIVPSEAQYS